MAPVYQEQLNQLLQALQGGEAEALDGIYFLIGGRMLALARGIVRNREDAEDIVNESFIKLVRGIKNYRVGTNGYAFVMRIVRNSAFDLLRRRKIRAEEDIDDFFHLTDERYDARRVEQAVLLEDAVKRFVTILGCVVLTVALFCGCGVAPDSGMGEAVPDGSSDLTWNTDGENYEYDSIAEQGFCDVRETPSSYFSLDRNTAGYSFVRAQIRQNLPVAADSVRLEELVNYFDYDYPLPEQGEGIGVSAYLSDCPWNAEHKLMTVGIRTAEAVVGGDANYVLLIDVSGSMGGSVYGYEGMSRLELVKYGANKLVDGLGDSDRVSIVTYASGVETVLESTAATKEGKTKIRSALSRLASYGSTSGSDGLQRAYEQAEAHKAENGNNRVIMLTDGDFNVGISDTDELTVFIQDKAKSGIALSVVGVGLGNTRDDLMQALALNGNGNYSYIDTQLEAEKVFTEELAGTLYTVAYDAKAGVTFNADTVSSYRLLGYDMKLISEDDFNNSEKDTGEIGSNLCVTVMYELVPNASAPKNTESGLANIAVRYRDTAQQDREAALAVTGGESETEDTQFASCVAEFALVLRQSKYRGSASLENVLARLNGLESYLAQDEYKQEFKQIVSLAEESGLYDVLSDQEDMPVA